MQLFLKDNNLDNNVTLIVKKYIDFETRSMVELGNKWNNAGGVEELAELIWRNRNFDKIENRPSEEGRFSG